MKIDRAFQKDLLITLRESFPTPVDPTLHRPDGMSDKDFIGNLLYLEAHKLLVGPLDRSLTGAVILNTVTATHRGMDFIEDDGGLSAILGTIVIRFEADTLRHLLSDRIHTSDLPDHEKTVLSKALAEMPNASAREIAKQVTSRAISSAPGAAQWIKEFLEPLIP